MIHSRCRGDNKWETKKEYKTVERKNFSSYPRKEKIR